MGRTLRTHERVNLELCGTVVGLQEGGAEIHLRLTEDMQADDTGLVHGGFVFGAADFAAMAAVDEPNVVLAAAEVSFLAPARVGDTLVFDARVVERAGKRRQVEVQGRAAQLQVFRGRFACVVPERPVLAHRD